MNYELWSTETDMLLGTLEVPQHVSEAVGERVVVHLKEHIETADGKHYHAIEVQVCHMTANKRGYWALETNLPRVFIQQLEGFTPKLERPSLAQMHYLNSNRADG